MLMHKDKLKWYLSNHLFYCLLLKKKTCPKTSHKRKVFNDYRICNGYRVQPIVSEGGKMLVHLSDSAALWITD
jgi:hypothetical protein